MANWVTLQTFATQLEAEFARARLDSADIPSVIDSRATGFFGPGFQGAVPGGVGLRVPDVLLDEAREVLLPGDQPLRDDDLDGPDDEELM
jgi:hypothetical protein